MKPLTATTISDQLGLFLIKYHHYQNEQTIAKELQISNQELSRLKYSNDWHIDQIRALKRLFKKYDVELVGDVKRKVIIKRK